MFKKKERLPNKVLEAYNDAVKTALLLCVDAFNAGKDADKASQRQMRQTMAEMERGLERLRDAKGEETK